MGSHGGKRRSLIILRIRQVFNPVSWPRVAIRLPSLYSKGYEIGHDPRWGWCGVHWGDPRRVPDGPLGSRWHRRGKMVAALP